jgi:predicted nuclease of predicted toxin-antitoxin system
VSVFADIYPGSAHVSHLGLDTSTDNEVRVFAATNDFVVVTKDADFPEMYSVFGPPPKIVWIRRGNCSTSAIVAILRDHYDQINGLNHKSAPGVITIY